MSTSPDIQYFAESGTWRKPAGAVRVDALVKASGGGGSTRAGADGELAHWSQMADLLPDTVEVEIGRAGRGSNGGGDGAAGYALIITHCEKGERP